MARLFAMTRRLAPVYDRAWVAPVRPISLSFLMVCGLLTLVEGFHPAVVTAGQAESANAAPISWVGDLAPISAGDWNRDRAAHLLERAGFGGTPEEVDKLAAMTPADAVNYLVDYETIPFQPKPFEESGIYPNGAKLQPLQDIVVGGLLTGKVYGIKATQEGRLKYQPAVNEFYTLLVSEHAEMRRASAWWAGRMVATPRPFEEKMTLFWHDHFATSQEKVLRYRKMIDQIETLRKNAVGNFRTMLIAVAQDPAMLIWLDNKDNIKGKPNENFAREIMELFTMGEGHGYSEHDIREMARAFTGWTMSRDITTADRGAFVDNPKLHDDGVKTFLGTSGNFNGYDAIDIILKQPAASRFVSGKLYKYFVRDDLTPQMNDQLAKIWRDANYDIKPLMKTMFLSRDFYSPASVGTQIKSPVHFIVSTYRKLGLKELAGVPDFMETSSSLGQVLFFPPNVAGWADGRAWINPSTLLTRGNFVQTLLFADPVTYGAPDKDIVEGYRKIPVAFPEYKITPYIWSTKTQKMEPVSLAEYDRYLAGISGTPMADGKSPAKKTEAPPAMAMKGEGGSSKMAKLSDSENYNLAIGVYTGFVQAYNRVKPIPRNKAEIDFARMARAAGAHSATAAVDYFCQRFLRVPLPPEDRQAVIDFLKTETSGEQLDLSNPKTEESLRRAVHLILSSPEYQLG